ncbi:hypothetical protein B0H11DRAFT_1906461 [Mycena galericulata]|nr:hypothetical protein B0H11DRAFT_1906461 [Mycena galericulata]
MDNIARFPRRLQGAPVVRAGKAELSSEPRAFHEFRGRGEPPAGLGRTGDVFWDIGDDFVFYVRDDTGKWYLWNPDPSKEQPLAEHPLTTIDEQTLGVAWLTRDTLKGSYNVLPGLTYAISGKVKDQLAALLVKEATSTGQEEKSLKRKREFEDIEYLGLKWENPTHFGQIPDTVKGMTTLSTQMMRIAAQYSESANATVEAVSKCVAEQTDIMMKAVQEAEKLRTENAQCKSHLFVGPKLKFVLQPELNYRKRKNAASIWLRKTRSSGKKSKSKKQLPNSFASASPHVRIIVIVPLNSKIDAR